MRTKRRSWTKRPPRADWRKSRRRIGGQRDGASFRPPSASAFWWLGTWKRLTSRSAGRLRLCRSRRRRRQQDASVGAPTERGHAAPSHRRRRPHDVPNGKGLRIHVRERPIDTAKLPEMPAGTRAVSVFLVNQREPAAEQALADTAYAFQAELEIRSEQPSCRARIHGDQGPTTGTTKWETCTMWIRPSTPPATASPRIGSCGAAIAGWCEPRGSPARTSIERPP